MPVEKNLWMQGVDRQQTEVSALDMQDPSVYGYRCLEWTRKSDYF